LILAASTKVAVLSCRRLLTPCMGDMEARVSATLISKTSGVH
jgi:hypothetical protein